MTNCRFCCDYTHISYCARVVPQQTCSVEVLNKFRVVILTSGTSTSLMGLFVHGWNDVRSLGPRPTHQLLYLHDFFSPSLKISCGVDLGNEAPLTDVHVHYVFCTVVYHLKYVHLNPSGCMIKQNIAMAIPSLPWK